MISNKYVDVGVVSIIFSRIVSSNQATLATQSRIKYSFSNQRQSEIWKTFKIKRNITETDTNITTFIESTKKPRITKKSITYINGQVEPFKKIYIKKRK